MCFTRWLFRTCFPPNSSYISFEIVSQSKINWIVYGLFRNSDPTWKNVELGKPLRSASPFLFFNGYINFRLGSSSIRKTDITDSFLKVDTYAMTVFSLLSTGLRSQSVSHSTTHHAVLQLTHPAKNFSSVFQRF